jgi:hypothetical protein
VWDTCGGLVMGIQLVTHPTISSERFYTAETKGPRISNFCLIIIHYPYKFVWQNCTHFLVNYLFLFLDS